MKWPKAQKQTYPRLLVVLTICMLPWYAQYTWAGQIYSFVDENGVYHYTNVPTDPRYGSWHTKGDRTYTKQSVKKKKKRNLRQQAADSAELRRAVYSAATRHGLDPALVKAVIEVESGWRAHARSPKGAVGLMQLMPETARDLGVSDRTDSHENIRGGTEYLKSLLERFDGDVILALAAYNAGPSAVEKYKGLPPYLETVRYVRKVLEAWNRYRHNAIETN